MRKHRVIYFNDARHYYLFVHEPPIRMEDAWSPVDEIADTGVNTFSYGVARGDGLFYPSRVGKMFGDDRRPFEGAYEWRTWENMQSLIARGQDPLKLLIDRAHDKGLEFISSLRMGGYEGMDPGHSVADGGRGFVHEEVRDHQFAVLKELVEDYPSDAVELDFAAAPGGSPFWLRPDDVDEYTPVMTDFVRRTAEMARGRTGGPCQVGARIYPTEELNARTGLDVQTWISEGLVDFLVPMLYRDFILDADMPFGWLVEAAHRQDIAVYGMLQPYRSNEDRRFYPVENASAPMMRAAAANYWSRGVDGVYTWFLPWPLGDDQRGILDEIGEQDRLAMLNKHYFVRRRGESDDDFDYGAHLPLEMSLADMGKPCEVAFDIADDPADSSVDQVRLTVCASNLVEADGLQVKLNGQPLSDESLARSPIRRIDPYAGQRLEYALKTVLPRRGTNRLTFRLDSRPDGLAGPITIEDVELEISYHPR